MVRHCDLFGKLLNIEYNAKDSAKLIFHFILVIPPKPHLPAGIGTDADGVKTGTADGAAGENRFQFGGEVCV